MTMTSTEEQSLLSEAMYGKVLLPHVIDEIARVDPDRPFAKIAIGQTVSDGYRMVSVGQLAKAINHASHWMEATFGVGDGKHTVGYMGPQDIRYQIFTLAGVKTGNRIFLPSLRNSSAAHIALLDAYDCKHFILPAGPTFRGLFQDVLQARELITPIAPELTHFLDAENVTYYPYDRTYEQGRTETLFCHQSSGSTGIPKPVIVTHQSMTVTHAFRRLKNMGQAPTILDYWTGNTALSAFPFFHGAGWVLSMTGILFDFTLVLPPPGPMTGELVAELIDAHDCTLGIVPPSLYADMVNDPVLFKSLKKLDYAYYGGGPVPQAVGDTVAQSLRLTTGWGSSEIGHTASEILDREDWMYIKLPDVNGAEYRHIEGDLHELVIVRKPEFEEFQCVFTSFPDLQEWPTKDLFSQHPTKPGLWRFRGRRDDIIVYSTGEKFNPSTMEDALNGHPEVRTAIVAGQGRFQSSVIIEPVSHCIDKNSEDELIDQIWPVIEKINEETLQHARVMKHMIIVTTADKPFPRAGKGTVFRRQALELYLPELDALYTAAETSAVANAPAAGNVELTEALRLVVSGFVGFQNVSVDQNLFDTGMDSLGVVQLVRAINAFSTTYHIMREVKTKEVYQACTIRKLAESLTAADPALKAKGPSEQDMEALFERYTADLPVTTRPIAQVPLRAKIVMITGSTGSLGSYLLDNLLKDDSVAQIICLNRSANARERQTQSMRVKGLYCNFEHKHVQFLRTNFAQPYLGLCRATYRQLLGNVTHIIHNAWQVDFNVSLHHLAPSQIYAVRQLVDFSAHSSYGAFIFFISSISSVKNWNASAKVPEKVITDGKVADASGYGQAKLVCERVLAAAATETGVPCAIVRVGQIAGPTTQTGSWPVQEWFPSLLKSSQHIGVLPECLSLLERIDWIPVDLMAQSLAEMLSSANHTAHGEPEASVFHAVNPRKTSWNAILPILSSALQLPTVPFGEWVKRLTGSEKSVPTGEMRDLAHNPAYKLLEFFKDLAAQTEENANTMFAELSTYESQMVSPTLAGLKPVGEEWIRLWLRQWGMNDAEPMTEAGSEDCY